MPALEELVRESVRGWDGRLEQALFGTDGPAAVASLLERFCTQELAEPVGAVLYRPGSVWSSACGSPTGPGW